MCFFSNFFLFLFSPHECDRLTFVTAEREMIVRSRRIELKSIVSFFRDHFARQAHVSLASAPPVFVLCASHIAIQTKKSMPFKLDCVVVTVSATAPSTNYRIKPKLLFSPILRAALPNVIVIDAVHIHFFHYLLRLCLQRRRNVVRKCDTHVKIPYRCRLPREAANYHVHV